MAEPFDSLAQRLNNLVADRRLTEVQRGIAAAVAGLDEELQGKLKKEFTGEVQLYTPTEASDLVEEIAGIAVTEIEARRGPLSEDERSVITNFIANNMAAPNRKLGFPSTGLRTIANNPLLAGTVNAMLDWEREVLDPFPEAATPTRLFDEMLQVAESSGVISLEVDTIIRNGPPTGEFLTAESIRAQPIAADFTQQLLANRRRIVIEAGLSPSGGISDALGRVIQGDSDEDIAEGRNVFPVPLGDARRVQADISRQARIDALNNDNIRPALEAELRRAGMNLNDPSLSDEQRTALTQSIDELEETLLRQRAQLPTDAFSVETAGALLSTIQSQLQEGADPGSSPFMQSFLGKIRQSEVEQAFEDSPRSLTELQAQVNQFLTNNQTTAQEIGQEGVNQFAFALQDTIRRTIEAGQPPPQPQQILAPFASNIEQAKRQEQVRQQTGSTGNFLNFLRGEDLIPQRVSDLPDAGPGIASDLLPSVQDAVKDNPDIDLSALSSSLLGLDQFALPFRSARREEPIGNALQDGLFSQNINEGDPRPGPLDVSQLFRPLDAAEQRMTPAELDAFILNLQGIVPESTGNFLGDRLRTQFAAAGDPSSDALVSPISLLQPAQQEAFAREQNPFPGIRAAISPAQQRANAANRQSRINVRSRRSQAEAEAEEERRRQQSLSGGLTVFRT